jgi:hypothetical protein
VQWRIEKRRLFSSLMYRNTTRLKCSQMKEYTSKYHFSPVVAFSHGQKIGKPNRNSFALN